jgi:hypothetical protein
MGHGRTLPALDGMAVDTVQARAAAKAPMMGRGGKLGQKGPITGVWIVWTGHSRKALLPRTGETSGGLHRSDSLVE